MTYTPKIVDAWLTQPYRGIPGQVRYHNRNWAGIQGIVIHVQEGNSNGTQQHFRSVKASSTVLIDKDGTIRRLVPEDKAPWTNGDVKNPDATIRAMMNKYGPDPNTWTLTIEREGFHHEPWTEAQVQAAIWQIRDWRRKYGNVPLLRHGQINSVDRPHCPEAYPYPTFTRIQKAVDAGVDPVAPTFRKGDTVRFTENLNVRRAWNLDAMFDGKPNVVGTLPAGTVATIIAGPNVNDGYTWWDVSIDGFGTGHVAGDWLEKTAAPKPEPVPTRKSFTTRFELPLRSEPGFNGTILRTLSTGTTGTVLEGPVDKDGIEWMKVKTDKGDAGWFPGSIMHTLSIAA